VDLAAAITKPTQNLSVSKGVFTTPFFFEKFAASNFLRIF